MNLSWMAAGAQLAILGTALLALSSCMDPGEACWSPTCPAVNDGLPACGITAKQVSALPLAKMVYPSATIAFRGGGRSYCGVDDGPAPANYVYRFTTTDSPDIVYDWYEKQLTRDGWTTLSDIPPVPPGGVEKVSHHGTRESFEVRLQSVDAGVALFDTTYRLSPAA